MKQKHYLLNSTNAAAASLLTTVMALGLTSCSVTDKMYIAPEKRIRIW